MTDQDRALEQEGALEQDGAVEQEPQDNVEAEALDEEALAEGVEGEENELQAILKEVIVVDKEDVGPLRIKMTVSVPEGTLTEQRVKQFSELREEAVVPGFRRGHAPLQLVEKRFSTEVGDQLATQIISSSYLAAVEKEDLEPLGDPLVWATVKESREQEDGSSREVEVEKLVSVGDALDLLKLPKSGDFSYQCEIELKPRFELPELEGISIEKKKISVSDEDVDKDLKNVTAMRGSYQPIGEGETVQDDDLMYVNMKMVVDGEVVESAENFDVPARNTVIKGVRLEGMPDAARGKTVGEEITYKETVPDDHVNGDIRGKEATFTFTVQEIKRLVIPELDQDFLDAVGFESEAELKDRIRENLEGRLAQTAKQELRDQVADHLLAEVKMDLPADLSQRTTERTLARRMMQMLRAGAPQAEVEKRVDELRTEAREATARDLKLLFILEKVAEELDIDVSEEEINGAISSIASYQGKRFDRVRDELSQGDGLMNLYLQIRDEKVLDALVEQASVSEKAE